LDISPPGWLKLADLIIPYSLTTLKRGTIKFGEKKEAHLPAGTYEIKVTLANAPLSNAIMSFGPAPIPAGVEVVATAKLINKTPTLDIKVK
jgi:hypothetical protein